MCTVYAVEALQALARNPGLRTYLMEHGAEWGPALWRLLLAEPEGPAYWVRARPCSLSQLEVICHAGYQPHAVPAVFDWPRTSSYHRITGLDQPQLCVAPL